MSNSQDPTVSNSDYRKVFEVLMDEQSSIGRKTGRPQNTRVRGKTTSSGSSSSSIYSSSVSRGNKQSRSAEIVQGEGQRSVSLDAKPSGDSDLSGKTDKISSSGMSLLQSSAEVAVTGVSKSAHVGAATEGKKRGRQAKSATVTAVTATAVPPPPPSVTVVAALPASPSAAAAIIHSSNSNLASFFGSFVPESILSGVSSLGRQAFSLLDGIKNVGSPAQPTSSSSAAAGIAISTSSLTDGSGGVMQALESVESPAESSELVSGSEEVDDDRMKTVEEDRSVEFKAANNSISEKNKETGDSNTIKLPPKKRGRPAKVVKEGVEPVALPPTSTKRVKMRAAKAGPVNIPVETNHLKTKNDTDESPSSQEQVQERSKPAAVSTEEVLTPTVEAIVGRKHAKSPAKRQPKAAAKPQQQVQVQQQTNTLNSSKSGTNGADDDDLVPDVFVRALGGGAGAKSFMGTISTLTTSTIGGDMHTHDTLDTARSSTSSDARPQQRQHRHHQPREYNDDEEEEEDSGPSAESAAAALAALANCAVRMAPNVIPSASIHPTGATIPLTVPRPQMSATPLSFVVASDIALSAAPDEVPPSIQPHVLSVPATSSNSSNSSNARSFVPSPFFPPRTVYTKPPKAFPNTHARGPVLSSSSSSASMRPAAVSVPRGSQITIPTPLVYNTAATKMVIVPTTLMPPDAPEFADAAAAASKKVQPKIATESTDSNSGVSAAAPPLLPSMSSNNQQSSSSFSAAGSSQSNSQTQSQSQMSSSSSAAAAAARKHKGRPGRFMMGVEAAAALASATASDSAGPPTVRVNPRYQVKPPKPSTVETKPAKVPRYTLVFPMVESTGAPMIRSTVSSSSASSSAAPVPVPMGLLPADVHTASSIQDGTTANASVSSAVSGGGGEDSAFVCDLDGLSKAELSRFVRGSVEAKLVEKIAQNAARYQAAMKLKVWPSSSAASSVGTIGVDSLDMRSSDNVTISSSLPSVATVTAAAMSNAPQAVEGSADADSSIVIIPSSSSSSATQRSAIPSGILHHPQASQHPGDIPLSTRPRVMRPPTLADRAVGVGSPSNEIVAVPKLGLHFVASPAVAKAVPAAGAAGAAAGETTATAVETGAVKEARKTATGVSSYSGPSASADVTETFPVTRKRGRPAKTKPELKATAEAAETVSLIIMPETMEASTRKKARAVDISESRTATVTVPKKDDTIEDNEEEIEGLPTPVKKRGRPSKSIMKEKVSAVTSSSISTTVYTEKPQQLDKASKGRPGRFSVPHAGSPEGAKPSTAAIYSTKNSRALSKAVLALTGLASTGGRSSASSGGGDADAIITANGSSESDEFSSHNMSQSAPSATMTLPSSVPMGPSSAPSSTASTRSNRTSGSGSGTVIGSVMSAAGAASVVESDMYADTSSSANNSSSSARVAEEAVVQTTKGRGEKQCTASKSVRLDSEAKADDNSSKESTESLQKGSGCTATAKPAEEAVDVATITLPQSKKRGRPLKQITAATDTSARAESRHESSSPPPAKRSTRRK